MIGFMANGPSLAGVGKTTVSAVFSNRNNSLTLGALALLQLIGLTSSAM